MKFATVCSGIGAPEVAWSRLGWQPVFTAEIEKFPSAVLAHRHFGVVNLGDMTLYKKWKKYGIDILCGGTPCQAFSVAGLRKGLDDPRGNLTITYLGVIAKYRPRWMVWENVPGVLSDKTGAFGAFLAGLAELGYGFAWRILDAQYFGVPQRRRRVIVVAHLGSWQRAAAVLFERHSLQGHPAPGREARKDVASTISARTQGGGGLGTDFDLDGGLVAPVLARCVTTGEHRRQDYETCTLLHVGFQWSQSGDTQLGATKDGSPPVRTGHAPAVAFSSRARGDDGRGYERGPYIAGDKTGALDTVKPWNIAQGPAVRRLTPRECERLQGFPDDYTRIPGLNSWRDLDGNETVDDLLAFGLKVRQTKKGKWRVNDPDGPRYKALGNSMAVPVMEWIGRRIQLLEDICPL